MKSLLLILLGAAIASAFWMFVIWIKYMWDLGNKRKS